MSANATILDERESIGPAGKAGNLPGVMFERSNAKGLTRLGVHSGMIACTGILLGSSLGTPWALPAILLHGVVLTFLFSPLHECIHSTAFRSRRLNNSVASACGFLLLLPREFFRAFHLEHHRCTQDPRRDPELLLKKPQTKGEYLLHVAGLPYWRERLTTLFNHARGDVTEPFIPNAKRERVVKEARLHVALYATAALVSLTAHSGALLVFWIVPVILGQPFLRAFLLAEHSGCPYVTDMLVNTRTTISNPVVRLLTWNMPYHAEHHAWAAVPFHRLADVHALAEDRIAHTSSGYTAVQKEIWERFGKR